MSYVLNISFGRGLAFRVLLVSSDRCDNITNLCYTSDDFIGTFDSDYFISMATVSSSRTGPFSDHVKSTGE